MKKLRLSKCWAMMSMPKARTYLECIGVKYGNLTVLRIIPKSNSKDRAKMVCQCDCGNETITRPDAVLSGHTRSCGCLISKTASEFHKQHGYSKTPTYVAHRNMLNRCSEGGNGDYFERGITVCERWSEPAPQGFLNFLEDMGEIPEGMSIDRIDVNGNYCKENCRWADYSTQSYNQRISSRNISGRTGVRWNEVLSKWRVEIQKENVRYDLGVYSSFEEACKVREQAEIDLYGVVKQ